MYFAVSYTHLDVYKRQYNVLNNKYTTVNVFTVFRKYRGEFNQSTTPRKIKDTLKNISHAKSDVHELTNVD